METNPFVITEDSIVSLYDLHPYIKDMTGFGNVICIDVLGKVSADALKKAKLPSEAMLNIFVAARTIIDGNCTALFKNWMKEVMAALMEEGVANGWTIADIMKRLNAIVGKQHALDGKILEAANVLVLNHFCGKDNIELYTQTRTGSDLGGRTDAEIHIGDGRFLMELKTALGSDWKRHIVEHRVNGVQQPFFLITLGFGLKESWVDEMKKLNCQPVTIHPSVITGVLHYDAFVAALKKEIERVKQTQASTV